MTKPQQFQVKDSGARAEFAGGMVRDTNEGKPRFDLLLPLGVPYRDQFLTRCAGHMANGAEKYDARNWEKGCDAAVLERYKESALRHLMAWVAGEVDEDHAAAVVFNLLAYETTAYKMELELEGTWSPWLSPAPGAAPARRDLDLAVNMQVAK
jgi:hypothetical protein